MPMIVRAYPLIATLEEVERFVAELQARSAETAAFYGQYGVTHESWHMQEDERGRQLISVTILADPGGAGPRYAAASHNFDK